MDEHVQYCLRAIRNYSLFSETTSTPEGFLDSVSYSYSDLTAF